MPGEFVDTLKELRGGAVPGDLTARLQELVAAVRLTGKGGSLTLTLDVDPLRAGGENTVVVKDTIRIKAPVQATPTTILYATADNLLTRSDPRQPELLNLRTVATVSPFARPEREGTTDGE